MRRSLRMAKSVITSSRSKDICIPILFEDDEMIIINKPTLMLSVPGRNYSYREPRNIEWKNAIHTATISENGISERCRTILQQLDGNDSIPRKKSLFEKWVSKQVKVSDESLLQEVWEIVTSTDRQLHQIDLDTVPLERISAQEFLKEDNREVMAVHRLDCETSGALIYAKSEQVASQLGKLFQTRMIHKKYWAIVSGLVATSEFELNFPLNGLYEERPKQRVDFGDGKPASTFVKVISTSSPSRPHPISVVELTPITGRTHQLRVHLAYIGHPIIGDTLYGSADVIAMSPRLELHARNLQFLHPLTGEEINIIAPNLLSEHLWPGEYLV